MTKQITIIALGSRGDIQPFIPLGRALQSAGHQVRVATFEAFADLVAEAGLGFHPIRGDARALVMAAGSGMLDGGLNPLRTLRAIRSSYGALAENIAQDLSNPALRDTRLVLNQLPGNLYGYDLAEYLGVPEAVVGVIPLTPTRSLPMMGFPPALSRLPGYNLLTYRLAEQMVWALFRGAINHWRTTTLHLPPQPLGGSFGSASYKNIPVVYGFSPRVVPRPPDWGGHIHMTGWWLPTDLAWKPPPALLDFLEDGPPPVFIGFGSMPLPDPDRMQRTVIEAVQLSGRRAILHAGWGGLGGELPAEVFPITYAPYGWLFERMAAIVHHGGSGTTGFGFHAGVPAIIVPFGFDQFYWGRRAAQLGVGTSPIPVRQLSGTRLAAAIREATTNPEVRRRAGALGKELRTENGIQRAVEIIEGLMP